MDALDKAREAVTEAEDVAIENAQMWNSFAISHALIAIADEMIGLNRVLESIDTSLHTLQEVAQWSEAGEKRTYELRQAAEQEEYEKETLNRAGWASNEEYESSLF